MVNTCTNIWSPISAQILHVEHAAEGKHHIANERHVIIGHVAHEILCLASSLCIQVHKKVWIFQLE